MSRAALQRIVFWALAVDFILLYLGAVKFEEPILTVGSLVLLGATLVAALIAF